MRETDECRRKTYGQDARNRCHDDNYDTGYDSGANALGHSRSSHNGDNSKNDDNHHADQLNQTQPSELSKGKMNTHTKQSTSILTIRMPMRAYLKTTRMNMITKSNEIAPRSAVQRVGERNPERERTGNDIADHGSGETLVSYCNWYTIVAREHDDTFDEIEHRQDLEKQKVSVILTSEEQARRSYQINRQ